MDHIQGTEGPIIQNPNGADFSQLSKSLFSVPQRGARAVSGPGLLRFPAKHSRLPPPRPPLEDFMRKALAKDLQQEVYNEITSVDDEFMKGILCSALSFLMPNHNPKFQGALYYATTCGLVATTKWLFVHPNRIELDIYPVIGAVIGGNKAIMELLLKHQPDILRKYGMNALKTSVYQDNKSLELSLKYRMGGHPDLLRRGAKERHRAIVELLLEHQPDILQSHAAEMLKIAVMDDNREIVDLLLGHQLDILREHGSDALEDVVRQGSEEGLLLLGEYGVDMKVRKGGLSAFTPLHTAVRADRLGIVEILLKFGADPFLEDEEGNTASALAKSYGFLAVECRLLGAEAASLVQSTALDIVPARRANPSEHDAKVKVRESSEEMTKPSIRAHGKDSIDLLEPPQDESIPDTGLFQQFPPAPQPIVKASGLFQALSIRDTIGVEGDPDVQGNNEYKDASSCTTYDSLHDKYKDGAEEERTSTSSVTEHGYMPESPGSSGSPSTDATDSIEDEAEGCDFIVAIDLEMQHTLEVLMTEFYKLYANWDGEMQDGGNDPVPSQPRSSTSRNDQRPSSSPSSSYGQSSLNSNGRPGHGKRLAQDQNSDDEGGDENGKKRPKRQEDHKREEFALLFACPYYKRDPATHCKIGSCTGPGFKSVSRVKEHLYRRHLRPPQCPRCGKSFNEHEELDSHARNDIPCEISEMIVFEGICPRKLKLLKCKKKNEVDPSEEGRWIDVFRILFPGAPIPPTPYFELPSNIAEPQHQTESFEQFSTTHLPGLVENRLVSVLRERFKQLVEEELKSSLPDIIKTSISDCLQAWKISNSSTSMRPGVVSSEIPWPPTPAPAESAPNMEQDTSPSNNVTFSELPVSNPPRAFMSQETIPKPTEPSDSSYTNDPDYHYPTDALLDLFPELSNQPTMMSTFIGAPNLWPSLPMQSGTSLAQNQTWGGSFDRTESI